MNYISNEQTILFDYANSDDVMVIDKGIRDTIKGIRFSILAMGIGLAKIKLKSLYSKLNCKSMAEYIERLCDETKMERSGLLNWLQIGEACLKYRNDLELAGFSENDGPAKLPYLDRALAVRGKQEVFGNIRNMSVREFVEFSKGEPAKPVVDTALCAGN